MQSHLLIGAASSGSGKTTFTLGLLRALKNRSLKVQPFKCGPDYIDTRHHRMAAGSPSVNLDLFMMSEAHVCDLYASYTENRDVAVTEGVMGLFDGYDGMKGSSAEIACMLEIPVVLIVNAKSTAYSVAPLLYGFKHFNKSIRVVGAVFNFVASESHYSFLKQACEDAGVEALGYLPKRVDVEIPSRHLGLSLDEDFCFGEFADRVAELVEKYVDIDRLLELTQPTRTPVVPISVDFHSYDRTPPFAIAIARDAAFSFMYEANIRYLHQLGEVTYFSPLKDASLPKADFVYLPGGYPELYLAALSSNQSMLQSIRQYAESGGKLLAECGGMMYLCDGIRDKEGKVYPMAGVLHQSATMENMKLRLGYRTLLYKGSHLKGHEFHYSRIVRQKNPLPSCAAATTAKGVETDTSLFSYNNVRAGYTHLYWADPATNEWFTNYLYGKE
ncbi:cobyrinate a,c-diamide synthase [Parabacteroides sp.]